VRNGSSGTPSEKTDAGKGGTVDRVEETPQNSPLRTPALLGAVTLISALLIIVLLRLWTVTLFVPPVFAEDTMAQAP
jgi:hypothetical protein